MSYIYKSMRKCNTTNIEQMNLNHKKVIMDSTQWPGEWKN